MKNRIAVLVTCAIFFAAVSAKAGIKADSSMFSIYGGLSLPVNDLENPDVIDLGEKFAEIGPVLGVQYMGFFGKVFGLGLDASYNMFSETEFTVMSEDIKVKPKAGAVMAVARFTLFPSWFIRPYAIAGAGINMFKMEVERPGGSESETSTGLALCGGIGSELDLGPNLTLGVETRYNRYMLDEDKFDGNEKADFVNVLAKLGFRFGGQ